MNGDVVSAENLSHLQTQWRFCPHFPNSQYLVRRNLLLDPSQGSQVHLIQYGKIPFQRW